MECSCGGYCGRCKGWLKALVGVLILINYFVWPRWIGTVDAWLVFFAVLLVLGGVLKALLPHCGCKMDAAPAKKKR